MASRFLAPLRQANLARRQTLDPLLALQRDMDRFFGSVVRSIADEDGDQALVPRIDVRLAVAEDGVLWLSVGDDGAGVPRHDSGAGQGLGTRLIRSIAQAIGASVRLTSTVDGTLVTVLVPPSPETPRALRSNDDRQGGAGPRGA